MQVLINFKVYYSDRLLAENGYGYVYDTTDAIDWVINHNLSPENPHIDIISMSFGCYDNPGNPLWPYIKAEFEEVCNDAYNAGIILIAGSGNDGYTYSAYPAKFNNVISVGGHNEDQEVWNEAHGASNGGCDVVAPAEKVLTLSLRETGYPDGRLYWAWGISVAIPHASALIALQLQYARENNIEPNNGYLWEVMKHSAHHLAGETYDPVYQGEGKIYAARTDVNDANIGSIDLIASNWPIDHDFNFSNYAFIDANIPVYQIGEDVNQTITLTNITDTLGNYPEDIENLDVNAVQVYYGVPNEPNLPGYSIEVFPTVTLLEPNDANSITLSLLYTIPPETTPGLKKTKLELEFNFVGSDRVIKVSYNEPNSFWYAAIPGDLDIEDDVDFVDYSRFAQQWAETDCNEPDWCNRADIDQSGYVDYYDVDILAENWLTGL